MTYEESIRYESERRARLMAKEMAKDMVKDMANNMAKNILYAITALQQGEDLPSITKRYGQDAVDSEPFQRIYKTMYPNGDTGGMSKMNLQ